MPRFRGAVLKAREMVADSTKMAADSAKMAEDSARQAGTNFDASLSASRKAVADSRILLQRSRLR
ncbi:hypothetical protein [Magnetospirillum fulvum]|uniref:Uncharacterized protein n=1 Tax=Magnetospirillum fulvum TaxID=1082 RepID=A0A1H6JJU3_MAGFU|nr:hypothetical protein [Magnetospirillum fulvum]SEH61105.1 hypothetical protein SAMN04244559_03147 [Magnetospirillum fulvum]